MSDGLEEFMASVFEPPEPHVKRSPRDDPRTDRSTERRHPDWIVGRREFPVIGYPDATVGWTRIPWESPDGLKLVDVMDYSMVDADGMGAVWCDRRWRIVDWMELRHDMSAERYLKLKAEEEAADG